jgi:glyoxylase-like metal-dependent hydrolase (beta-lactamase superfamily II)
MNTSVKVEAVTEHLTQLTRLRLVNAFLVREEDGFTLVDTTFKGGSERLLAAAERSGGAIRRIALTHGHDDHVGSLDALKERLGDAVEVLIPEVEARILAGEAPPSTSVPGSRPRISTVPDVLLSPGDRVGSLEVVASPGHTPGHVAFLDVRDRSLVAGDVFTAFGRLVVTSHRNLRFPITAMATWDRALNLESARALRALRPAVVVVGHGSVTRRPEAALDEAVARAERALVRTA